MGPEADLADCNSKKFATHFASDAGATRPEWMITADNGYVTPSAACDVNSVGTMNKVPYTADDYFYGGP